MELGEQDAHRIINGVIGRLEWNFPVTVTDTKFRPLDRELGKLGSREWRTLLTVEGDPSDWKDIYEAIDQMNFHESGQMFTAEVVPPSNGAKGELHLSINKTHG